jgi:hypothetical protein
LTLQHRKHFITWYLYLRNGSRWDFLSHVGCR